MRKTSIGLIFLAGHLTLAVSAGAKEAQKSSMGESIHLDRLGEMVTIPAGDFLMGNNGHEGFAGPEEFPQHAVTLPSYQIGKYEVTRAQYRRFMEAGGYDDPNYWSEAGWKWKESDVIVYAGMHGEFREVVRPNREQKRQQPAHWEAEQEWIGHGHAHPVFTQTDAHPVVGVTYYEAEAYCKWAGGRLPTEAEWEKAARWDAEKRHPNIWPWGDTWEPEYCNNPLDHNPAAGGYRTNQSAPVGSYPDGASPYGCMDMVGNAYEWVADTARSYPGHPQAFEHAGCHFVRGGCWDDGPFSVRCAYRGWYLPASSGGVGPGDSDYIGFRVARSIPGPGSEAAQERVVILPNAAESDQWQFSPGGEFPGAKGQLTPQDDGAMVLAYDFTDGGAYVAAYYRFKAPVHIKALQFRARKPEAATLTLRVTDSQGQTFQKSVLHPGAHWTVYRARMGSWTGHWGGANDGICRPPFRQIGLLVEKTGVEHIGQVELSHLSYEEGRAEPSKHLSNGLHQYQVTDFGLDSGFSASQGVLRQGRWSVDFARTPSAWLSHSLSLLGQAKTLTLTLRSNAPGAVIKMRLGSHFQTFEREIGTLKGGLQTFTVPAPPSGWRYYGGENDGKVHPPLRVSSLILEKGVCESRPVEIHLQELVCATVTSEDQAVSLLSGMTADGERTQKKVTVTCQGRNLLDHALTGILTLQVLSWDTELLYETAQPWTLAPRGRATELRFDVPVPETCQFAEAKWTYRVKDLPVYEASACLTRALSDPGDATLRPESPWGMGVYLYRYPHHPEGLARMDRAAAMARAAGVKWSREEFSWARIETRPGGYDFRFYDQVVDTALRHGISVYGLLAYWSRWTEPYTEQGIDAFCCWARAVVLRYRDRIKHWEIYNEPNIFFWSGPRDLYPVLMKKCYQVIKEADPEATVLAISTAGIDRRFIQFCMDANAPFDILTIHPYRRHLSEPGFARELQDAAQLVEQRPVWITEMGWSTQIQGTSERQQASLLARCYLTAVASGACQNVSWYNFRSDGSDPFYNEHNFGVLRADLTPKPAYRALATVCRSLDRGRPVLRKDFGEGVWALQMGDTVALWTTQSPLDVTVTSPGPIKAVNLMGEPLKSSTRQGHIKLKLRPACPVFVKGKALRPVAVNKVTAPDRSIETILF